MKIVPDNTLYAKAVHFIGTRKNLTEDKLEGLEEIVMDSTKAEAIFEAGKMSMGEGERERDDAIPTSVLMATFTIRVHLSGRQQSALITPHWKELHRRALTVLAATPTPSFMQFCCTVGEKSSFLHTKVLVRVATFT